MKRNIITLVFEKVSKWKGELYPLFDRESEQKLFEKKRARAPPEDKGDKKYRSGGGSTPARTRGLQNPDATKSYQPIMRLLRPDFSL
jgi:hypothetical protein